MTDLRLEFDRGTLLCRGAAPGLDPGLLGMRWDERVGSWRAPACRLDCGRQSLPESCVVLPFRRRIDACAVLRILEARAASP